MAKHRDPWGARRSMSGPEGRLRYFSLEALERRGLGTISRFPYSVKVLLEAVLRQIDGYAVTEADLEALCRWGSPEAREREIPFKPARVVMQDFTGVPAVVDLAAMRDALAELGGEPDRINPVVPVELVIDHSVQVDRYATARALEANAELEFQRNRERYELLRWAAGSFEGLRVVPPATGIVHQVNLEYLARVVERRQLQGEWQLFPDSLVGTDSHTPMVNGIGVLGWGVGGIEAEAALLGQPLYMLIPEVVGVRLTGRLAEGVTATDLVLTITQALRRHGVVGRFVEFFGPGVAGLGVADRATVANMSPEYGATVGFFPVDAETLRYLAFTGRSPEQVALVERYTREQGLFRHEQSPEPRYSEVLELELSAVEATLAGPRRPQDRLPLAQGKGCWEELRRELHVPGEPAPVEVAGRRAEMGHGAVVIAAITSCTNTSNPAVMIGAGLLARRAVELGLQVPPYVKTSLAPGSRVVTRYLERSGLLPYLQALGFHLVGYGCTTCIGNSGPLHPDVSRAIREGELTVAAVLSGNRNFEGRIHPEVRASYLGSPPLVVAYALAGTMEIDLLREPLGRDRNEQPVYLRDIWPSDAEIAQAIAAHVAPEMFREEYADVFQGNETWNAVQVPAGSRYRWEERSGYIRRPPFFEDLGLEPPPVPPLRSARVLALLGDSVTTDHISPAGAIPEQSPAGRWLIAEGVRPEEFNSYGSRRGNHEVMIRGTFANIRIRNRLLPGVEGGYTRHLPSGERLTIYEAAQRYRAEGTPLLIVAGKEYGSGSSRDWAAKGTALLGVRAVLAESFERIHRSNLIGMGVLPLQFAEGQGAAALGLSGEELYAVEAVQHPGQRLGVTVQPPSGAERRFEVLARLDTPVELEYYRNGGILQTVLRSLAAKEG
jgi:aconitate hydratase